MGPPQAATGSLPSLFVPVHADIRRTAHGSSAAREPGRMRFEFRFSPAYRVPALVFGITPRTAYVEVDEAELRVRYGLWRLQTPRGNVAGTERTGGFRYLKTVGPAHLSLADRGVSFATNGDAALCVHFHEPVTVLDPTGRLRHPAATLTVADPDGLAAALGRP